MHVYVPVDWRTVWLSNIDLLSNAAEKFVFVELGGFDWMFQSVIILAPTLHLITGAKLHN